MSGSATVKTLTLLIAALLLFAPFLFQDTRSIEVAARICVFIVLAASYDLLLGYTGIVSFAHVMFFGFGAYGIAITSRLMGPGWDAVIVGTLAGSLVTLVTAIAVGMLSLRVRAIFFAMITLAAASVALVLASQLSQFTGGEDGITYKTPQIFKTATKLMVDDDGKVARLFGVKLNGKLAAYYFVFFASLLLFWVMLRLVGSPLGTVLKAIRENEFRAEALGYRVVFFRTFIFCAAALIATASGALYAIWLKYTGPDTALSFTIMIDVLLMVVIGGMGTLYGAVIGAVLLVLAHYYLRDLMAVAAEATHNLPLLPHLLEPDRWLLWLGVLFILLVYFFPKGIAGTLSQGRPS